MSALELARLNLTSVIVLSFALGVMAALVRSDLRLPAPVTQLLSVYLLFAIGLKGGVQLRLARPGELLGPLLVTLVIGVLTPLAVFAVCRPRLGIVDGASMAAHYGSVSAVTFTAAVTFATEAGLPPEGFLPALVAVLEVPGIIVALLLAVRLGTGADLGKAVREVVTGKSVVLLMGGIVIGFVSGPKGYAEVKPFFGDAFKGVLCLFLLDLGVLAGGRLSGLRRTGRFVVTFALTAPLVLGLVGVVGGTLAGLDPGGAAVLGAMTASASYIAAPAAVQVALPDADPGVSLTAALAVTFPFNLAIGIPLYYEVAKALG